MTCSLCAQRKGSLIVGPLFEVLSSHQSREKKNKRIKEHERCAPSHQKCAQPTEAEDEITRRRRSTLVTNPIPMDVNYRPWFFALAPCPRISLVISYISPGLRVHAISWQVPSGSRSTVAEVGSQCGFQFDFALFFLLSSLCRSHQTSDS